MSADNVHDLFGQKSSAEELSKEDEDELSKSLQGRFAEFMVCAQLSKAGFYVTHVDGVGFDLVIKTEFGSFTIQVKSTHSIIDGWCRWRVYMHDEPSRRGLNKLRADRAITPQDADMLALYHHVYNTTLILPIRNDMATTLSFKVHQVKQASLEASLASTLWVLTGRGTS